MYQGAEGLSPFSKLLHGCRKADVRMLGGVQSHLLKGGEQAGLAHVCVGCQHGCLQLRHVLLQHCLARDETDFEVSAVRAEGMEPQKQHARLSCVRDTGLFLLKRPWQAILKPAMLLRYCVGLLAGDSAHALSHASAHPPGA